MPELHILSPDGQTRTVPLDGPPVTFGRSSAATFCYPEDAGLSRQHLVFERDAGGWLIRDLGSKNGTLLNGKRVNGTSVLHPGDRISAGHLIISFDKQNAMAATRAVVFVEPVATETKGSTVITEVLDESAAGSTHVRALLRAGNELAGERPLPELFRFILDLSIQAVQAERGVLMTLEGENLEVRATRGQGFRISSAVRDRVILAKESILVRDTALDDAFRERRSIVEQNIRTLMAVPLQTRDKIIGLIYLDSPSLIREFTKDDLSLLTVMANVAAIRIEQSRFAEMEKARQIMARELEQAAEIQRRFLPAAAPNIPGIDVAGHNAPCRTVGGDYFDFFAYPNGRVAMVLGDVSGKGMPASLLMMALQARVQVLIDEPDDLAQMLTRLNRITAANCPENRFITLFICILDATSGELVYCNAGHNPPVLVRAAGGNELLEGGGPVLGILRGVEYTAYHTKMESGDVLAIYSDGVTEAATPADDEFEIPYLTDVVRKHRTDPAAAIISAVNEALAAWTEGAPPADDITLIVARKV